MSASDDDKPLSIKSTKSLRCLSVGSPVTAFEPGLIAKLVANEEAANARDEAAKGPKPDISAHAAEKARSKGQCTAIRRPRGRWARDKHPSVCGREAVRAGMCKEHYLRDILKVSTSGKSPRFRPFWQYQVPLRDMTDIHHETLRALPVTTPYDECITRMNEADPSASLKPIYAKSR